MSALTTRREERRDRQFFPLSLLSLSLLSLSLLCLSVHGCWLPCCSSVTFFDFSYFKVASSPEMDVVSSLYCGLQDR
jgi:hypothetical protein